MNNQKTPLTFPVKLISVGSQGETEDLGEVNLRFLPGVGDYLDHEDSDGIAKLYRVIGVWHPTDPASDQETPDLYVDLIGPTNSVREEVLKRMAAGS